MLSAYERANWRTGVRSFDAVAATESLWQPFANSQLKL
jgi:hypothetical protein